MLRLVYPRGLGSAARRSLWARGSATTLVEGGKELGYAKVIEDIDFLRTILGNQIEKQNPELHTLARKLRTAARDWRDPNSTKAQYATRFKALCEEVECLSAANLRDVARAFSHLLALTNVAETHTTARMLREMRPQQLEAISDVTATAVDALPAKLDSCAGTIDALVDQDGASVEAIYAALIQQQVEIVFTAHPTEVNREELLAKHRNLSELLMERDSLRDNPLATTYERKQNELAIHRTISAMWDSDILRRSKPSPQEEARDGLSMLRNVLWDAVPSYLRRLDAVVLAKCAKRLPLKATPLKFSSWMGGDRDGNPNVTSSVTREVVISQRRQAALLYLAELNKLRIELSVHRCNAKLAQLVGNSTTEPYKALVSNLIARLRATVHWADSELVKIQSGAELNPLAATLHVEPAAKPAADPIFNVDELAGPLEVMHESLVASGYEEIADGDLVDLIRRVAAFGLQLAPLDLRQESERHARAVDAICNVVGVQGYLSWSEEDKVKWLSTELMSGRPLLRRGMFERLAEVGVHKEEVEVLQTAALTADLPTGSLSAYIISQATSASDVLAVELLMAEAGASKPLPVAPLFETLDDLNAAPATLRQLFNSPGYADRSGRKQLVMVGYSDSAKDAGRIAAMWAQYTSQEKMLEVAKECGFDIKFFHGKGGTVGRGGNPEGYKSILAHPQGTINGFFRVTEQGEMIAKNYGDIQAAERTLDIFTSGVLRDQFLQRPVPTPEWRAAMAAMSDVSCEFYRSVVRGEPKFVPYFRSATPELELGDLNVGSRPAKRNPKGGVESLRAIPWIFAWAQTRLNLPVWLGIGKALEGAVGRGHGPVELDVLQAMYKDWPWFRTTIDLIEGLMAKSERAIAEHYDKRLVTDPELLKLGAHLRERFLVTEQSVLAITGHPTPADANELQSLRVRNHKLDVLNIIQVETLVRLRNESAPLSAEEQKVLKDALLITINGIATGMRNSA
eukprot:TRINITY_DN22867_c0_g2_i1.p1 TRINITY_DN22867_c0_g2~~TRINITY_DN22867_c0_g2_i1.p1  ORF type:complete len:971 (-),score=169.32 TRINITY_DN22867_c0_g2_i1:343-3255(-)